MAHAQKPDFVFRRNGRVHLNRRGRQFSRLLAAEVCASAVVILDTPCSEVVWRVLATHSIRQFPLYFSCRASPCAVPSHFNWSLTLNGSPLLSQIELIPQHPPPRPASTPRTHTHDIPYFWFPPDFYYTKCTFIFSLQIVANLFCTLYPISCWDTAWYWTFIRFRKTAKSGYKFRHVYLSVRMEQLVSQ